VPHCGPSILRCDLPRLWVAHAHGLGVEPLARVGNLSSPQRFFACRSRCSRTGRPVRAHALQRHDLHVRMLLVITASSPRQSPNVVRYCGACCGCLSRLLGRQRKHTSLLFCWPPAGSWVCGLGLSRCCAAQFSAPDDFILVRSLSGRHPCKPRPVASSTTQCRPPP
jgi:hypothetical protein